MNTNYNFTVNFFHIVKIAGGNENGFANGLNHFAKFNNATGIALNPNNNYLYISDTFNHCIRMLNEKGMKFQR